MSKHIKCLYRHETTNLCLNCGKHSGNICNWKDCSLFREDKGCSDKSLSRDVIIARGHRVYIRLLLDNKICNWEDIERLREVAKEEVPWQGNKGIRPCCENGYFGLTFELDEEED